MYIVQIGSKYLTFAPPAHYPKWTWLLISDQAAATVFPRVEEAATALAARSYEEGRQGINRSTAVESAQIIKVATSFVVVGPAA